MRFLLLCGLLCGAAAAQQLRVKSADSKAIRLEWTGSGSDWTIERTAGSAPFQKLATSSATSYEDTKIDPYGTYRYRVVAASGAKPSNEVVAGPPPIGIYAVAPAPKVGEPGQYGNNSAMARDENGDPVIAFVWQDPNGDSNMQDTEVDLFRWDRAAYAWTRPVKIATTGDLPAKNVEPVSVACDAKSGALVVALPIAGSGVNIAISTDRGATWKVTLVESTEAPVASTAVAINNGVVHLAWPHEGPGAEYRTGAVDQEVSKWSKQTSPAASGWKTPDGCNVALALDAQGRPLIAYYAEQEDGTGRRVYAWHPGANPSVAWESKATTDFPNLAMTFGASRFGLLVSNPVDPDKGDYSISYTSSADGGSWTKPSVIPPDGPRSTNHPEDVAIDSKGRITAVFGSNSGSEGPKCGAPVMSRSADGSKWSTCSFAKSAGGDFEVQPNTIHVLASGDDTMFVLWDQATDGPKQGRGLLLWHGR